MWLFYFDKSRPDWGGVRERANQTHIIQLTHINIKGGSLLSIFVLTDLFASLFVDATS